MNETTKCTACGNFNAVLVSSGFKKPENKGRKYFTCANCKKFQWVETTTQPSTGNPASTQNFNQSLGHQVDTDAEGKVRHGVVVAVIQHGGLEALKGQMPKIERIVNYIMTGVSDVKVDD